MIYFDTSYLLKCYLAEPGHMVVRNLARESGPVACCALGKTECRAATHRHLREGKLTAQQAASRGRSSLLTQLVGCSHLPAILRPLPIEHEGAIDHVLNPGDRANPSSGVMPASIAQHSDMSVWTHLSNPPAAEKSARRDDSCDS